MNPFRYLELALALLLLGAGAYGVWSYHHLSAQAERIPELEAKVALLATGYQTLSNETIRRSEFDSALREARAEFSPGQTYMLELPGAHGDSGAGVFDTNGNVIGVISGIWPIGDSLVTMVGWPLNFAPETLRGMK